ncbi:serine/threonine protein kinase [Thermogemmata fonticola]|uniref:Serine/threonine protein kinase n=1 Tax=Thermogemmata fonticola TaxID=2755323 RepID=A0A7V9AAC6_9BACT|nr:serine/threonine-protein kinase [Thermogemmata fonticola]MBA2224913.1 serine/threonine protein kinase [Thermogemmata fonticola]
MPPPSTAAEFLDLLRRSQLVPEVRLDEVLQRHRQNGTLPQQLDPLANLLIREGLLTYFQAKQLKLGRYKRFTIAGKYKLLELIGVGGMGAVYLCEHMLMRRLVALKVLPIEKLSDPSHEERFYREARAVAALDHPNIVRAYDIDKFEQLHFLVMEYVDGTSLQEIVARYVLEKRLFDPLRAAHYIAQAALGLQHGHELGMVHRDIKPGNLLLDRHGCIKVLDMGLARFFNKQQDCVTEKYDEKCVLGTADYLAPEQAVSNIVDIRADIYSLGATFYFLLTGQPPFPEGTVTAKLVAHQTRQPRPVESFRKDVPPNMLKVLRVMMAKNPADRFQQPVEVVEALSEWVHQPIDPPPAREMPQHCPLVRMIAGPSTPQPNAVPLARLLFSTPRTALARGTTTPPPTSASATLSQSTVTFGPLPSSSSHPSGEITVPVGPASTARSSAAPTLPFTPAPATPVDTSSAAPQASVRYRSLHWPFWLLLAALLLLFATALYLAYLLGRGALG